MSGLNSCQKNITKNSGKCRNVMSTNVVDNAQHNQHKINAVFHEAQ